MSEPRSIGAYQRYLEAAQKFDYFITGLTGALCAYIAQSWKPQKMAHFGPEALEPVALLLLFIAAVSGFKRIEWTLVTLRLNSEWLHALEKRGAMAGATQSGSPLMNNESGDFLSPRDAMNNYQALSEIAPEIRANMDYAADKSGNWYKWRNRFLFAGFLVLVAARFAVLFW